MPKSAAAMEKEAVALYEDLCVLVGGHSFGAIMIAIGRCLTWVVTVSPQNSIEDTRGMLRAVCADVEHAIDSRRDDQSDARH